MSPSPADFLELRRLTSMLSEVTRAHLMRSGLELGLFAALAEPVRETQLIERLGLAPELAAAWLRAADAHGLIDRCSEPSDAYRTSRHVRWLLESPDSESLIALLDQSLLTYAPQFDALPGLIRGGNRPTFRGGPPAQRAAAIARLLEPRALEVLSKVPGVHDARSVLDIGCGYGTYLSGLLCRYRDAHGVGVEIDPDVGELARQQLIDAGVSRRAEIRIGDFMEIGLEVGTFDLALLNNNLYYFPPDRHYELLTRAHRKLAVGGVIAIQVPIATSQFLPRVAGLTRTTTALDLFLRSHANLYGLPDLAPLQDTLREAGFGDIGEVNILPGGSFRYVWARKSALDRPEGDPRIGSPDAP